MKSDFEIYSVILCEVIEKKKKAKEDRTMVEEEKRVMVTRLEERISYVQKITNTQLDMINQLMLVNQELNHRDVEIENLNSQKEILRNELKYEKQYIEKLNKPTEEMKYFEELLKSSSCSNESGYSCIEKLESSRNGELRNAKLNDKPTCYHYGRLGHTTNIYRIKYGMQNSKPKFIGYYFQYKKQGHKYMSLDQD